MVRRVEQLVRGQDHQAEQVVRGQDHQVEQLDQHSLRSTQKVTLFLMDFDSNHAAFYLLKIYNEIMLIILFIVSC